MDRDIAGVPAKSDALAIRSLRPFLFASGLILSIAFSYFFIDRALAGLTHPYHDAPFFVGLTYIAAPLTPIASLLAAFIGARALARGSVTEAQSQLLRAACAVLIAGVLTHELKELFGRTWPETWVNNNPSYFSNGTYGFFPFHAGQGWRSFPSGHTAAIAAVAGAIWYLWPKLRWLATALSAAVAIGLLGANYHWLSDVMAGAVIGFATGAAAAKI